MTLANKDALSFLLSRRSRPAKTLVTPVPDKNELMTLLTAAARTPDHGKLEPWRFVVIEKPAMERLSALVGEIGADEGIDDAQIAKGQSQFDMGNLAVVVVASPKPSEKVPEIEQVYSAGAACLGLLNAALAAGWGANWLSGWASHHPRFCSEGLGLAAHEKIAGIMHIGTEKTAPPERPRPDVDALTTWADQ